MFQYYLFKINNRPFCCWEIDVKKRNIEFLNKIDWEYFIFQSELFAKELDKEDKQKQSQERQTENKQESQEEASSEPSTEPEDVKELPIVETPIDNDSSIRQVSPTM